jgi:FkbM family methyltransferase
MYLGTQIKPRDDSDYRVWAQLGVTHVCGDPPGNPHDWSSDDLKRQREHVERFWSSLDVMQLPLASRPIEESLSSHVLLGRDLERQRELNSICLLIGRICVAGIPAAKDNLNMIGIPYTARDRRRGSRNAAFRWQNVDVAAAPSVAGVVSTCWCRTMFRRSTGATHPVRHLPTAMGIFGDCWRHGQLEQAIAASLRFPARHAMLLGRIPFGSEAMAHPPRKIAFILAATDHGTLIVNRFDYRMVSATEGYGVGFFLLESSSYEPREGSVAMQLLGLRRQHFGDGVVAVDCGANIGVHSVDWAKGMTGWGRVVAIEAQERIFYALAGNITINNCFNARAIHAAVGAQEGSLQIPVPNYRAPASFGSLELRLSGANEFIGQDIDYSEQNLATVRMMTIDSLNLPRLDLIKIDVEGMEIEALEGAKATLQRFLPIIVVERLKVPTDALTAVLASYGYEWFALGLNFLAVHPSDPARQHINVAPPNEAAQGG